MVAHLASIAEKEGVTAETEALHVVAEKADGALRDALSIFDRLVTFSGNNLTYKDAIENLNILDHDYYFKATDLILEGNIAASMLLFNEVLENGFNGHEFVNGLACHFRNLLMCQDASTVKLLEVSERVQQRFLDQAAQCTPLNLLKALRYANECDVQYKSSKNQRLTVELAIMKMCALHRSPDGSGNAPAEKKKQLTEIAEAPRQITEPTPAPAPAPAPTPVQNEVEIAQPVFRQATESVVPETTVSNRETTPVDRTVALRSAKRFSRPGSVKISDADKPVEEEIVDPTSLPQDAFSETYMQRIWQERVNLLFSEKPSLLSSLTKHKPVLKADHTIELKLDGRHQVEQLNENRSTLLEALRTELNNFSIELETPVEEGAVKKKAYTSKEIYQNMVDQNPHVEELRLKLGLDLDV